MRQRCRCLEPVRSVFSPALFTTLRAAVRLAVAAGLAIAMVDWCGRGDRVFLALIAAVLYVSETHALPWSVLLRQFAAGVVGILTALVLFQVADGWLMLSVVLLVVALLIEGLRLQQGRGMAFLLAWGVLVMDPQRAFNIPTVFDLALTFAIGLFAARLATALVWPQAPGARVTGLDQTLRRRLIEQVRNVERWLQASGAAPAPLASAALLPAVLELEQHPSRQLGLQWRLIVRHWLLLEPQLLGLRAPITGPGASLLLQRLQAITAALAASADPRRVSPPMPVNPFCSMDSTSALVALAIEQQLNTLDQVLRSLGLLRRSRRWRQITR